MQSRPILFALVYVFLLLLLSIPVNGQDAVSTEVSVPRLIRISGSVPSSEVVGKVVGMTFALYREQPGETPLWLETQSVALDSAGRYSVVLGAASAKGVPASLFASNEARWLGVTVEAQGELPRVLLVSVPYALKAGDAETLGGMSAREIMSMAQPMVATNVVSQDSSVEVGRPSRTTRAADSQAAAPGPRGSFFYNGSQVVIEAYNDASQQPLPLLFNPQGGNIGIGTTTPGQKLSVAGTIESTVGGFKFPDGTTLVSGTMTKSFNGRTGAVMPTANDYSFSQLSGAATLAQLPAAVLNSGGSYADPAWLTSLAGSKISGTVANAASAVSASNATTVTNGVYTSGSYANPTWLTSLASSKITGTVAEAAHATNADSAVSAGSAVTATNLNGVAATYYARRDTANSFSGNQTISGGVGIGVASPTEAVDVNGNVKLTGAVKFGDGTSIQSALALVPTGFTIMGASATAPTGYSSVGWQTVMNPLAWSRKASMPSPQACGAYGVVGGKLYIITGFPNATSYTPVQQIQVYDPATDSWSSRNPAGTARVCPSAVVVNEKIYIFGGFMEGGAPIGTVEEYTPATDSWVTKTPMPTALAFTTAAAVGTKIYLFGGDLAGQCCSVTNAVSEYDTAANSWRAMDPMPIYSRSRSAAALNGKVYLFGGVLPYTTETDVFDPSAATGSQWKTKTPRPTACEGSPTIVYNNLIFLFACWNTPVATAPFDVYVPENDTWVSGPPVPRGASAYDAGLINGMIYVTAGGTNTEIYTDTYQLDPAKVILYLYTKN